MYVCIHVSLIVESYVINHQSVTAAECSHYGLLAGVCITALTDKEAIGD